MIYVDAEAEETRDSVDGGAWETTNELCGCRNMQEKPGILQMEDKNQGFLQMEEYRRQPMISVNAGAGETRDSVDGGAGDNQ